MEFKTIFEEVNLKFKFLCFSRKFGNLEKRKGRGGVMAELKSAKVAVQDALGKKNLKSIDEPILNYIICKRMNCLLVVFLKF